MSFYMVNWQITAKTVYCEPAGEEVTIIIKKDWSVQCTGYSKFQLPGNPLANAGEGMHCEGLDCRYVTEYKNQIMKEEGSA